MADIDISRYSDLIDLLVEAALRKVSTPNEKAPAAVLQGQATEACGVVNAKYPPP